MIEQERMPISGSLMWWLSHIVLFESVLHVLINFGVEELLYILFNLLIEAI
jgi:hypothetical protein